MKQQSSFAKFLVAGALTVTLVSLGSPVLAGCGGPHDIVDTAVETGKFNTLVAAVKAAGLVDTLKGDGPFTVFAPSDEAFAKLPEGTVASLLLPENKDKLVAILTYHVVSGKILSTDVKPGRVASLQGSKIRVSSKGGNLMVDNARIVSADVSATNGVIHVINEVIMPEAMRSSNEAADASKMAAVR